MVWYDSCFYLRVILYALDFLVDHGNMDEDLERNMMANAINIKKVIQQRCDEIIAYRKSLK